MKFSKQSILNLILVLTGIILPILCYELYLRSVGYQPLSSRNQASIFRFPLTYENDEILGWKLIPGEHSFMPVSASARETRGRILEGGQRATHSKQFAQSNIQREKIIFWETLFFLVMGLMMRKPTLG